MFEHFLAREPAPDQRIEIALATLNANYITAHSESSKTPEDCMPFLKAWPEVVDTSGRYSETDREILKALMG